MTSGDEIAEDRVMRGRAFCDRWLIPAQPLMHALWKAGQDDLEWAIPAHLWDAVLMDGPTPATFRGLPLVRDDSLDAATIRPR